MEVRREAAAALEHVNDGYEVPWHAVLFACRPVPRLLLDHAVDDRVDLGKPLRSTTHDFHKSPYSFESVLVRFMSRAPDTDMDVVLSSSQSPSSASRRHRIICQP